MLIVFHGENAGSFSGNFADLLDFAADVVALPDVLASDAEREFCVHDPDRRRAAAYAAVRADRSSWATDVAACR